MTERWLPVVGYEGYFEVSDRGNLQSVDRVVPHPRLKQKRIPGQPKALRPDRTGKYLCVTLCRDGVKRTENVHVLMLQAFAGPRPEGMEGCHANDIGTDNRIENLRWDTPSANGLDRTANGNNHNANKTQCAQGHEFTEANTMLRKRGHLIKRDCRKCHNARQARRYYRMKA